MSMNVDPLTGLPIGEVTASPTPSPASDKTYISDVLSPLTSAFLSSPGITLTQIGGHKVDLTAASAGTVPNWMSHGKPLWIVDSSTNIIHINYVVEIDPVSNEAKLVQGSIDYPFNPTGPFVTVNDLFRAMGMYWL